MGCGRKNNIESTSSSSGHKGGHHRGCICEVVRSILDLQNEAIRNDCDTCGTNCFLEPLGGLVSPVRTNADTRVFMLLDKHGKPFTVLFVDREGCYHETPFFRVEDMFDCCATLRAVAPIGTDNMVVEGIVDETTGRLCPDAFKYIDTFRRTDTCVTVDLDCFCAIQCVEDVDLNICN